MKKQVLLFLLVLISTSAQAKDLNLFLHGSVQQGEMILGHVTPKSVVFVNDVKIIPRPDGWFMFGIGRDDVGSITINVKRAGKQLNRILEIKPRKWDIQRVDGVPQNTVTPSEEEQRRIAEENKITQQARRDKISRKLPLCFVQPTKGRISGIYGSQRILNGIDGAQHNALDIAAKEGTAVRAAADGIVLLAYDQMLLSGKTMIIAHGQDVTTSYIHLSKMFVKEGQVVKKGDLIAAVGTTGRSTGPHLHWTVMWQDKRVDPQVFLKNTAEFCLAQAPKNKKEKKQ